ncbi:MAG: response regulator [Candidatus Nanopelagicales bacterium]
MTTPRRVTVLVVDDDARVRAAALRMLDELPDVDVAAVDTEQALRLSSLTVLGTDVAVVDLPGPGNRGHLLIGRLAPAVAVVAVSLDTAQREAAARAGARAFVEKDGDDRALVEAIRAAAEAPVHNVAVDPGGTSDGREGPHRCQTT